jgi:hypothetical protein
MEGAGADAQGPAPGAPPVLLRIAVVVVSLLLAFTGAAFVVAAAEIADTPTCRDVNRGLAEPREGECFDGSTARRAVQVGLLGASGVLAVLTLVPAIAFAARGIWLRVFALMIGAAVLLFALYALAGRVG